MKGMKQLLAGAIVTAASCAGVAVPVFAGEECDAEVIHGTTGSGITGVGNWVLTDVKVWDDGNGPALYITGRIDSVDGVPVTNIAKFDGISWSSLGDGVGQPGTSQIANCIEVFDDGDGEKLYVGGSFSHASNVPGTAHIAKWDGTQWLPAGSDGTTMTGGVQALAVGNVGQGMRLFAAASNRVWQSDGGTFEVIHPQFNGGTSIRDMQVYTLGSQPYLFVGGQFTGMVGGPAATNLIRWDGNSWSSFGHPNQPVFALEVHDDGEGPALYVGGNFTSVAGMGANRIAKVRTVSTTTQWSALGTGMAGVGPGCSFCTSQVRSLASFDDGSGPVLYAGGTFGSAGGNGVPYFAKWKDNQWLGVDGMMPTGGHGNYGNHIHSMSVHDGCGPLTENNAPGLFVAGHFTALDGNDDRYVTLIQGCSDDEAHDCQPTSEDINCDGSVGVPDLLLLLEWWGNCQGCICYADFDGDGTVGVPDLLILLANWG